MPPVSTNDLKNGMTLVLENNLMQVVEFQHVKPGKGHAFVRSKLKNVRSGAVVEKTFRAGETVERANIDKREMQYLYTDGDGYVFMDNETYDQISVSAEALGDTANYVTEINENRLTNNNFTMSLLVMLFCSATLLVRRNSWRSRH